MKPIIINLKWGNSKLTTVIRKRSPEAKELITEVIEKLIEIRKDL